MMARLRGTMAKPQPEAATVPVNAVDIYLGSSNKVLPHSSLPCRVKTSLFLPIRTGFRERLKAVDVMCYVRV